MFRTNQWYTVYVVFSLNLFLYKNGTRCYISITKISAIKEYFIKVLCKLCTNIKIKKKLLELLKTVFGLNTYLCIRSLEKIAVNNSCIYTDVMRTVEFD